MAKVLDMPKLSPTMEEGQLTAWHKKEGDAVGVDDLLAEVETDKATMEFRAFDKGTILKLLVPAGSVVKLGQPVAILGNAGESIDALLASISSSSATPATSPPASQDVAPPAKDETAPPPAGAASAGSAETKEAPPPALKAPENPPPARKGGALDRTEYEPDMEGAEGRVLASPFIRKQARERGLDLRQTQGSGPHGRIALADLDGMSRALAKVESTLAGPPQGPALAEPEAHPLSMMRKAIARRLTESKRDVPHFYLTIDVDAGPLVELRERVNKESASEDAEHAAKLSVNDFLIKACALGLVRVPECNATFTPEAILIHRRVDISVAVAIPDGLVTPVVRNADQKSVAAIGREVRDLAARAKQKKLRPEEMTQGTFSISNLGMFGIDAFSAVINPPEGAILAVGRVREEAVVVGGRVSVGKRLAMTLSCDHRVVDGAVGASFLAELRALLQRPMQILAG